MNRNTLIFAPVIAGSLAVAACAPVESSANRPDPALAGPPVKVLGEAESCIRTALIRDSLVRSDQVIDFELAGGKVYRNVLDNRCPGLGFERAFTYSTSINRLCSPEIIFTLEQRAGSVQRGAACGLGKFVPVEYIAKGEDG